jgi:hypothetical protein
MTNIEIGYKRGKNNRIIVLKIVGKHNESRKDIVNKNYAKMRCSKAKVIDIYNMDDKDEKFNEAFSLHVGEFKYTINEIVEPDKYDEDLDMVCTGGIHYFKSFEAAYYWNFDFINYTGEAKVWHENGQLAEKCNNVDGEINGLYEAWYENGQLSGKCNYVDGVANGLYEAWHKNGQLARKYNMVSGKIDGLLEKWSETGIRSTEKYSNGIKLSLYAYRPQQYGQQLPQQHYKQLPPQYQQPQYGQQYRQQYGQQYQQQQYQQQQYGRQYQQPQYRQQSPQYYRPQYYQQQYYRRY